MGYYDYDVLATPVNNINIWTVISVVVAIIGGITLFYTFLSKENDNKFKGFLKIVYDFFNFKLIIVEDLVRILYLIMTIGITLLSFNRISDSFFSFIVMLVIGNLILRIGYELTILTLELYRNVREINKKTKK